MFVITPLSENKQTNYRMIFIQQVGIEFLATLFKALGTQQWWAEKNPCPGRAEILEEEKESTRKQS